MPIAAVTAGETLTDHGQADNAIKTIRDSIETAADLGCSTLNVTIGTDQDGIDRATQHENVVEVLSAVAPDAAEAGVTLALEPLNTAVDHPGYYLTSSDEGFGRIDEVDSPNVRLLYDVYHQQITERDVIQTITENIGLIGHVNVADVPGCHESGTGELNYPNVIPALDDTGYDGYVGCEYEPAGDPEAAMATVLDAR